jgi:hypothetical protein
MLLGAFQPPTPDNRILLRYALECQGDFFAFSTPAKTLAAPVSEKLRAAWVSEAPPGSFDSAPESAVSGDKSVRRSAQDDGFAGGLEYNWLTMQKTRKDRTNHRLSG